MGMYLSRLLHTYIWICSSVYPLQHVSNTCGYIHIHVYLYNYVDDLLDVTCVYLYYYTRMYTCRMHCICTCLLISIHAHMLTYVYVQVHR